ncbi:MAG: replication initiation factor domain-containing protein [Clostridia bacterium]|nr:replication initiation factor domain-containing protein [Clostridia bacterium]
MQFEQLNIDTQRYDVPQPFVYHQLDNDGKIYCKLDWLTAIFQDCSLNHVLRWLKLDDCVSDFCATAYEQSRGYDQVFKFVYNGILIETSSFNFYGVDLDVGVFDTIVPKIRLELSGSALDYLRSIGVNMDSYRFVQPDLPLSGSYHFTRADWAYDFINYKPEFVDQMLDHIASNMLPSGRIPLASTHGAIGCRVVTGGQKTVYLGSPQADKMLRVYDKKMQFIDLSSGLYKKTNPYNDPDSWFRIEWQTRNRLAHNLVLDQNHDFKSILRLIFDSYAFAKGDHDFVRCGGSRPVVDFWLRLFDWKEVESRIIQNANFV